MVDRFDFDFVDGEVPIMEQSAIGEYVRFSDYASLQRENAELRAMVAAVRDDAMRADNELCAMEARAEDLSRQLAERGAELARKDAALKPFADIAECYANNTPDDYVADGVVPHVRDLRAARAALSGSGGGEDA